MTTDQINHFVEESKVLEWLWYEIEILGGEPTLHPDLFQIIDILYSYMDFNPDCQIILVSNGHGKMVKEILTEIPSWIVIDDTSKRKSNQMPFNDYNIAPIDLDEYNDDRFLRGCKIVAECGLGLTRYGYYPCGAGASVDRVFGFDIGIKRLCDVNDQELLPQRELLCRYCGHYKGMRYKVRTCAEMSFTWIEAYRKFRFSKPTLSLYGLS